MGCDASSAWNQSTLVPQTLFRVVEVVGATIVSPSRTPVLSYDHFFQAPATQAIYSRNLFTDVVLFFFSLSSKTSVSAESEKEE